MCPVSTSLQHICQRIVQIFFVYYDFVNHSTFSRVSSCYLKDCGYLFDQDWLSLFGWCVLCMSLLKFVYGFQKTSRSFPISATKTYFCACRFC